MHPNNNSTGATPDAGNYVADFPDDLDRALVVMRGQIVRVAARSHSLSRANAALARKVALYRSLALAQSRDRLFFAAGLAVGIVAGCLFK